MRRPSRKAGLNAQKAMALLGHTSLATHGRYLTRELGRALEAPEEAMPPMLKPRSRAPRKLSARADSSKKRRSKKAVGVRGFEPPTAGTQIRD